MMANEHPCFGLSCPWSFPSRSGILMQCRRPTLTTCTAINFTMKSSTPCSAVSRHSPIFPDCSRPPVGVDTESSEIVQETPHSFFFLVSNAARAPHHFSGHHALRQSCVLHARHTSREQDPPPAHNRLDALTSRLHNKRVQIRNCVIGAIARSPKQRVRKLWWARRGMSYSIVSSTSTLSIIRVLSSRGALGRSYNSRVYFRKLHHALRMHRLASIDRSALWLTFPPRYSNSLAWLYTWLTASTLKMAVDS